MQIRINDARELQQAIARSRINPPSPVFSEQPKFICVRCKVRKHSKGGTFVTRQRRQFICKDCK